MENGLVYIDAYEVQVEDKKNKNMSKNIEIRKMGENSI